VKTILIISSDLNASKSIETYLKTAGYSILITPTGDKAINIIEKASNFVDLILIDLDLKGSSNGAETAKNILEIADFPIIFLYDYTNCESVTATTNITSYGYVIKNKEFTILDTTIKSAFNLYKVKTKLSSLEDDHSQLIETAHSTQIILDNYEESIALIDREFEIIFMNSHFEEEFKKAFGKDIYPGLNIFDVQDSDAEAYWKPKYEAALGGEKISFEFEENALRGKKYFRINLNPIHSNGWIKGISMISMDITKQKLAEIAAQKESEKAQNEIKRLLEEKEIILKEVHHRIKNNMNTLIALISLQTDRVSSKEAIEALEETENRIMSMMVLYDKLYRSKDFQSTSLKPYLSELVDNIMVNFPGYESIKVEKDIDEVNIKAKVVFNIGIIINELITNSMKYAFTGRKTGKLIISVKSIGTSIIIVVGDDGLGLPDNFDIEQSTGFGMMLVQLLVSQLDGEINIDQQNGTKFTIKYHQKKY